MLMNFNTMPTLTWNHFKGGEKHVDVRMYKDQYNRINFMKLEPGASIGYHIHDDSSEIIYVLSGTATAVYDEVVEIVEAGMCEYCPKGHSHGIINKGDEDLVFFSVVAGQ